MTLDGLACPLKATGGRVTAELIDAPTGRLVIPSRVPGDPSGIRLSLVIPTFNEAHNVGHLLAQLGALFEPVLGQAYELVVVDDDSPDRTWAVALELAQSDPRIRVVRRQGERGLSTAVIRGWQVARGEILGVMDADLQHPAEVNLGLLGEIERGATLATASRHVAGGGVSNWSLARRVLSRGAQLLGLLMLPAVLGRLSDPMSGYFMLRREGIADVELDPLGYKILIEVLARGNIRWIGEVGYVFRERVEDQSKVTWRLYVQYLRHLLKLRIATLPNSRFLKFCLVGGSGVLVDMGLLYLLSDPHALGMGLTRSKILAAETAILTNFLLNDVWTFRDLTGKRPGGWPRVRRFLGFNAICSFGLALNVLLLNLLFNFAKVDRYVANAIAIVAVTGWNYWLNRKLNWAPLSVTSDRAKEPAALPSRTAVAEHAPYPRDRS
ncbi:MAG TPA: glycosyltransferase [Polyangiaceae bacterium]|nr:glycosyltransferase [Polyangiaceae bacterium]